MSCRCGERRQSSVRAVQAIARGDRAAAATEAKFVLKSSIEDAARAAQSFSARARSVLMVRR